MSEETKATIDILEHYHHNGGYYEIPVEIINTVEQELEELDKLLQQKENIIKEVREYLDIDESIRKNCKRYDVNGIAILEILDRK